MPPVYTVTNTPLTVPYTATVTLETTAVAVALFTPTATATEPALVATSTPMAANEYLVRILEVIDGDTVRVEIESILLPSPQTIGNGGPRPIHTRLRR